MTCSKTTEEMYENDMYPIKPDLIINIEDIIYSKDSKIPEIKTNFSTILLICCSDYLSKEISTSNRNKEKILSEIKKIIIKVMDLLKNNQLLILDVTEFPFLTFEDYAPFIGPVRRKAENDGINIMAITRFVNERLTKVFKKQYDIEIVTSPINKNNLFF